MGGSGKSKSQDAMIEKKTLAKILQKVQKIKLKILHFDLEKRLGSNVSFCFYVLPHYNLTTFISFNITTTQKKHFFSSSKNHKSIIILGILWHQ